MKKILLAALMAVAAMCYVGCKEDEDMQYTIHKRLNGSWELHEGTLYQRYDFVNHDTGDNEWGTGCIVYRDSAYRIDGKVKYDSILIEWHTMMDDPEHKLRIRRKSQLLPTSMEPLCGWNPTIEWADKNNTMIIYGHVFHRVKTPTYW